MVIYLRHPRHGTKVAISEDEVAQDEKRGWVVYDPAPIVEDVPVVETEVDSKPKKSTKKSTESTEETASELPDFLNTK
jgi:hypothetical protein